MLAKGVHFPDSPVCFFLKSHRGSHGGCAGKSDVLPFDRRGICLYRLVCFRGTQGLALFFFPQTLPFISSVHGEGSTSARHHHDRNLVRQGSVLSGGLCSCCGLQLMFTVSTSYPPFSLPDLWTVNSSTRHKDDIPGRLLSQPHGGWQRNL